MKKSIAIAFLIVLLLSLGGVVVASSVDIEGDIIFAEGTTVEEAVTLLNENEILLVDYIVKDPYIASDETYSAYTLEGAPTVQGVLAHYWGRYDRRRMANERFIESIEKPGSLFTVPDDWERFKAQVEVGNAEFSASIEGCWNTSDCPDVEIVRVWAAATVLELTRIADAPIVQAVGWPALLIEPIQVKATDEEAQQPEQEEEGEESQIFEWIANVYAVESGDIVAGTRYLDMRTEWSDADKLSEFVDGTAYRQGVDLDDSEGYYTLDTNIFNRPKMTIEFMGFPASYIERRGIFGGNDYSLGVIRGEDLEAKLYRFQAEMDSGLVDEDSGNVRAQFGTRVCRFTFCGIWDSDDAIVINPTGLAVSFPGDDQFDTVAGAGRFTFLPLTIGGNLIGQGKGSGGL